MIALIVIVWRWMVGDLQEWERAECDCDCPKIGKQRRAWARRWWLRTRYENASPADQYRPNDRHTQTLTVYSPGWAMPLDVLHFLVFGPAPKLRKIRQDGGGDYPRVLPTME